MSLTPRRRTARALAALAVSVALLATLTGAATALAASSNISQQDCNQGTIRDQSGQPISRARCERLIGKSVQLASTGFDLWPLTIAGAACLGGAAVLTARRRRAPRPGF